MHVGLALVVLGSSSSVTGYATGTLVYDLYWSLVNGAVQAYLYNHLKQAKQTASYAKHIGQIWVYTFVGAAAANILSGFIADAKSLRIPYYISIGSVVCALLIATSLKTDIPGASTDQKHTSRHLVLSTLRHETVLAFAIRRMFSTYIFLTILEFGQIYLLSFGVSAKKLGALWAVTAVVCVAALLLSALASRNHERFTWIYVAILVLLGSPHRHT